MFDLRQHQRNRELDRRTAAVFDSMADVLSVGQQGVARIDHFAITPQDLKPSIEAFAEDFVPLGRYARLRVNGQLMMTDTPMEKRTNLEVVQQARGRVLIAGLGLGMILRAVLKKPEITHITVLEKYRDVIDLVLPSLLRVLAEWDAGGCPPRLEVLNDDVFQWEPTPGTAKFHTIYFDIWPNSVVENLPQMRLLHKRYRPLLVKGGWMSSWTYNSLCDKERADARFLKSDLPRKLWRTLHTQGGERLADAAVKMLLAPEVKIDAETKLAIVGWLRDHQIQLECKLPAGLAPETARAVREHLAAYGVAVRESE